MSNEYHKTPMFYGNKKILNFIPKNVSKVKILEPRGYRPSFELKNLKKEFLRILENPLNYTYSLSNLLKKYVTTSNKYLTIIVDDITRPNVHTRYILPLLLDFLDFEGVRDFKIIIANGTHKIPALDDIRERIFGIKLFDQVKDKIISHDCDHDTVELGYTSKGTPILLNKTVWNSGLIIPITDSEYHWFAGQAGTIKSICPGVSGRETIRKNHPMMFDLEKGFKDSIKLGNTKDNPIIEDMKEIINLITDKVIIFGIDVIINNNQIVYLNAGDLISLHEAAKKPLEHLRVVKVPNPADIVLVSAGSLGLNLYQTGKAFHAGWNAVRKDGLGKLIVLAPCNQGHGNDAYFKAMESCADLETNKALKFCINTYCSIETFKIGNQKNVDLLRIIKEIGEGNLHIMTEMDSNLLKNIFRINAISTREKFVENDLKEVIKNFLTSIEDPVIYIINDPSLLVKVSNISND